MKTHIVSLHTHKSDLECSTAPFLRSESVCVCVCVVYTYYIVMELVMYGLRHATVYPPFDFDVNRSSSIRSLYRLTLLH